MLSTLFNFFAQTYLDVFGFKNGPPIHDVLVVAYVSQPDIFTSQLCKVDVDRSTSLSKGAFVVDPYERTPPVVKNVNLSQSVNVSFNT